MGLMKYQLKVFPMQVPMHVSTEIAFLIWNQIHNIWRGLRKWGNAFGMFLVFAGFLDF